MSDHAGNISVICIHLPQPPTFAFTALANHVILGIKHAGKNSIVRYVSAVSLNCVSVCYVSEEYLHKREDIQCAFVRSIVFQASSVGFE